MIKIFTDGGARGNPGPAGIGVFVEENGAILAEIGKRIGETTNNVAEYKAVIEAFNFLIKKPPKSDVHFFLDSLLVCSQLNGVYKVKDAKLRELLFEIRTLESQILVKITYSHVRREQNKNADRLVNAALDGLI